MAQSKGRPSADIQGQQEGKKEAKAGYVSNGEEQNAASTLPVAGGATDQEMKVSGALSFVLVDTEAWAQELMVQVRQQEFVSRVAPGPTPQTRRETGIDCCSLGQGRPGRFYRKIEKEVEAADN